MKRFMVAGILLCLLSTNAKTQQAFVKFKMKPVTIQTRWARQVNPKNALPEYPRPQMQRKNWINLNGLWKYAITSTSEGIPTMFNGDILVPYPIESALSGVKKTLDPPPSYNKI